MVAAQDGAPDFQYKEAVTKPGWITRGVIGIILATFFSDVGHEMVTAMLPLYLGSIGLGAAALGVMEGVADFLSSLAKLSGGAVGHRTERKKPFVAAGYLVTALGTSGLGLVSTLPLLATLRSIAWMGRGFRSPLRDFLLADEVEKTHYGRAYGVERSADMLGAVVGPLVTLVLVALAFPVKTIILLSFFPSFVSVLSIVSLTHDRGQKAEEKAAEKARVKLPRRFWIILGGVVVFGLGDFSRSFLILLATQATGGMKSAVALYVVHNFISALVAYPTGRISDHRSKLAILGIGYALGAFTNGMLAFASDSFLWLAIAVVLSGTYIAIQETVEKAAVAELLSREQRSLGLGILASANAVGDMVSSIGVGVMLAGGHRTLAFAVPAVFSILGTLWIAALARSPTTPNAA
jgi:MFS family permease